MQMDNYCASSCDSFWSECKIVPAADCNGGTCGFVTPGSTITAPYNSDAFRSENSYLPADSSDVYSKFNESERLENSTTKQFFDCQHSTQHGYTQVTNAFPIYQDSSTCLLSNSSDFRHLNRSRCPLAPVSCNYDNVHIYEMMGSNKMGTVPHPHSHCDLLEAAVGPRDPGRYDQGKGLSIIEQTLPAVNNSCRVSNINISSVLGSTNSDNDRLHTLSSDKPILRGKKIRRHIPHYLRPQDFVERRNSRERSRIGNVNDAFEVLRRHIPALKEKEGASKINILRFAVEYIKNLGNLL